MKRLLPAVSSIGLIMLLCAFPRDSVSYPSDPVHGGRMCMDCHKASGPWQDNGLILTDILDARTERSFRTGENEFTIPFGPGEEKALIGNFGVHGIAEAFPRLISWSMLDDNLVEDGPLASSKLPAGWSVNRPYGFSYLDDKNSAYPDARVARVPFAIQRGPGSVDAVVSLHVLVQGERDTSGKQTAYEKATIKLQTVSSTSEKAYPSAPAAAAAIKSSDDIVKRGMEVFKEKKCGACHRLNGIGGTTGPELTTIGHDRSREELKKYLANPSSVYPNSYLRPVELSEEKLEVLLDFLQSLK